MCLKMNQDVFNLRNFYSSKNITLIEKVCALDAS